jgi:hypothetical protein
MKCFASRAGAGKAIVLFALLLGSALGLAAEPRPPQAEPARPRVTAGYRAAEQFYRIAEFFTPGERTGGDIIRRSQPDERAGYYFTVRLRRYPYRDFVTEAIRLEVILPGDVEPSLFTFSLGPQQRRNPLILIGLTGEDWPDRRAVPLAWRLSFVDAEGTVFARDKSFLWGND